MKFNIYDAVIRKGRMVPVMLYDLGNSFPIQHQDYQKDIYSIQGSLYIPYTHIR